MYDTQQNMGENRMRECKPDYEEMASTLKKRMDVYVRFREVLIGFIQVIGRHSLKREPSSLPELLGTVDLDCLDQQAEYNNLLSKIEDGT